MLLVFVYNGKEIHSHQGTIPPQLGTYAKIIKDDNVWLYKVQQIENEYSWKKGIGELEPRVTIFLRKLRPGEFGNRDEPTGYGSPW